jgi:hypothetical protein
MRRSRNVLDAPETSVAIFAFLLNLPWELAQVPLFAGLPAADHWRGIVICGQAALGDVVIALAAFWTVAVAGGGRTWITAPRPRQVAAFVIVGLLITIVLERLATTVLGRWTYADAMPIVPLIDVGLSPVAQWVVTPLLIVCFVRRQLE